VIHQEKRAMACPPSDFSLVRRQMEQRFERTKMILREESKMIKYQKMQQIYEHKFKSLVAQPKRRPVQLPQ
jgi:hypothetical protein